MSSKNETKTESVKTASRTEADTLWDQIKKTPITMFGLTSKPLEELVARIDVVPDKLHLSLRAPGASIAFIEDKLNVRRDGLGGEVRVDAFDVETTNNGMLVISRKSVTK
jgi:hypothetical protein